MIRDHVWRPLQTVRQDRGTAMAARPCAFMNCRRHRTEHQRPVSLFRKASA